MDRKKYEGHAQEWTEKELENLSLEEKENIATQKKASNAGLTSKGKAMIIGHAIGDALGVPVEFTGRKALKQNPVQGMREYGVHSQPAGTWSDDTSMTLCLLESIARTGTVDCKDAMDNFVQWVDDAKFTAHNEVFDIGITTRNAINKYKTGTEPVLCGGSGERDNGNGSLMRIAPLALYFHKTGCTNAEEILKKTHDVSSLTHAHPRSLIACGIYVLAALELLRGTPLLPAVKEALLRARTFYEKTDPFSAELKHYERLLDFDSFAKLPEDEIKSSGYVVDTLEASLWCLANSKDYRQAVLAAVNLGRDTDTVGAVTGGLAGLAFGWDSIPKEWKNVSPEKRRHRSAVQQF